jgi:thiamine biosynthesis lipoprotein
MNGFSRAQALLGALVTLDLDDRLPPALAAQAGEAAFAVIREIGQCMSAHDPGSDLGRISRAQPGEVLSLNPHTIAVLQAAIYWHHVSSGAFHPVRAAQALLRQHKRPGLAKTAVALGGLQDLVVRADHRVHVRQPIALDLGGIAKGYAVDQALAVLQAHGVTRARLNAGGDIGLLGTLPQQVVIRHAQDNLRDRLLQRHRLGPGGIATSVAAIDGADFVATTRPGQTRWRSATVWARDCMTADVLTKWALQSSLLCPLLRTTLRRNGARMWRSA